MVARYFVAILFLVFNSCAPTMAAENTVKERTSYFNEQWMKTVVSIEVILKPGTEVPIGTGFLIDSPNKHIILLTAKHVILDEKGNLIANLAYRLNEKSGKSVLFPDELCTKLNGGKWFLSKSNDLACRFIYKKHTSDVLFIPQSMFLVSSELNIGAPIIISGFPMGLRSNEFSVPIARRGMVARADTDSLIVDGFVFPGNSGGPAIYCPSFVLLGDREASRLASLGGQI